MNKKKKNYLIPSVKVVDVEAPQILAGSGIPGTEKYSTSEYYYDDEAFF